MSQRRSGTSNGPERVKAVYLCHAYQDDPASNAAKVRRLCGVIAAAGLLPLAPQIYLPQFIDEATERDLALRLCLALVSLADELRVYGPVTAGMRLEIEAARRLEIPVVAGTRPEGEPTP